MTESALKPIKLKISISGEDDYNGEDHPFPWQYISDSLSQNILWYAYREPKTVEELSRLTGVPAFYIEERIQNLITREAVIQPTQNTVQTDFLIFDEQVSEYGHMHSGKFAQNVSEEFYAAAKELTEKTLRLGIQDADRTFDELICLFSLLALEEMVQKYKPTEFKKPPLKYDGRMWEYHANIVGINDDGAAPLDMNHGVKDSYAHYVYHFPPFVRQSLMYDYEIAICQEILRGNDVSDRQKEDVSKMIADGYLRKRDDGRITVSMPVFTTEQFEKFKVLASDVFGAFMPHYNEQFGRYVREYIKLFPSHLKDAANRHGFYLYVSMFTKIASAWLEQGKIKISDGAICDVLIGHN